MLRDSSLLLLESKFSGDLLKVTGECTQLQLIFFPHKRISLKSLNKISFAKIKHGGDACIGLILLKKHAKT